MRHFLLLIFLNLTVVPALAGAQVTALKNGEWSDAATWSCHCLPANNADIEIPANIMVTVSKAVLLTAGPQVTLTVSGRLALNEGIIYLDRDDRVIVARSGSISATGKSGAALYFGKLPVFVNQASPLTDSGIISAGQLPDGIVVFKAQQEGDEVCVSWSSRKGFNCDRYLLERSSDGIQYEKINQQCGVNETPEGFASCFYYDGGPLRGIAYYRLSTDPKEDKGEQISIAVIPTETHKATF